jgi:ubiquinone/menaquinone biosynthesis C-methylase UbiE
MRQTIPEWERAEIERSAVEATHKDINDLRYSESNIARYLNPPADTWSSLEYSYYLLGDVNGKTVLDLGCGDGENTVLLSRRGAQVKALDISDELIKVARHRLVVNNVHSGVDFFVGSAHGLPLADESIDVVFGMAILHHLELPLVAREVHRVLRKGGRAIFSEPVRNSKLIKFIRNLIPYRAPDVSPFERPLTDKELRDFGRAFSAYRSKSFSLPYVNLAQVLPVIRDHIQPLYQFDKAVLQKIPFLGYYASIRVIELVK